MRLPSSTMSFRREIFSGAELMCKVDTEKYSDRGDRQEFLIKRNHARDVYPSCFLWSNFAGPLACSALELACPLIPSQFQREGMVKAHDILRLHAFSLIKQYLFSRKRPLSRVQTCVLPAVVEFWLVSSYACLTGLQCSPGGIADTVGH